MTLRVEYTDGGDLRFDLIENGKVIPKEDYNTKQKSDLTTLSSMMIPDLVEAVLDMCGDSAGIQFMATLVFLSMTDNILRDMERKTKSAAERAVLKKPGTVKIAIDKNALKEALRKEKEEQDRGKNDGE